MEKVLTLLSENISVDVANTIADIMPMGHICVCYLSSDRDFVKKAIQEVCEFEYKITYVEYPDDVICDDEVAKDIKFCDDDVRLFLGIGGGKIANLLGRASLKRQMQYVIVANTPFLYGVAYATNGTLPIKLLIDKDGKEGYEDYARCIGVILAHRVALWEKKYIHYMLGIQDYTRLKNEQDLLDKIIGNGQMSDTTEIFDGILEYAKLYDMPYKSSVEILAELIEHISLTTDKGESLLLAGITLVKYFKCIMSIDEYSLIVPADISTKCLTLAKIIGNDVSNFIGMVKNRKFKDKWLYIHREYRQDLLNELEEIDAKLINIVKSAKRFMADVGYHLGEEYDVGEIINLVYNLSPLVHECSPIAMGDVLFGE